jgi:predicted DNA-binding transcriptional regulator AlpA
MVKKCNLQDFFQSNRVFGILLDNEELFYHVQMQTGGYGVAWDTNMTISDAALYQMGVEVPLSAADFKNFVIHRVITAAEAAELLGCSRQNIDDLTRRGKLHPIKTSAKTTLYLKSEILKRNWK